MASTSLSQADIKQLISDPSAQARAVTVEKIATDFNNGVLSQNERKLAQEIFRLLLKDAAVRVREAMAQSLKNNALLPHDIAVSLARDVDSVSLPVLEYSQVLTDEDLLEIISAQSEAKQTAIAGRQFVSEAVSDALVSTDSEKVVTRLVSNEGALISENSLTHVLEALGENEAVQAAMAKRPLLPITVVEKLMNVVSDHLKNELARHQDVRDDVLTDIVMQTWERATITLSSDYSQDQLERLIKHLQINGRLKPSVVVRALCLGDIRFFETAIAVLAGLSIQNARLLIHESGMSGLQNVCKKAHLPEAMVPAICAAVAICGETEFDGEDMDIERYKRRVVERILSQYGEHDLELGTEDLEYLFAKLAALPPEARPLN